MIEELTGAEVDELLRDRTVGRIGCHADGVTYVVPVIYAYDGEAVYVASVEGQKTRMMRTNPRVCFEIDEHEPGTWRSVVAQARYEELAGAEAERALALLTERFAGAGRRRRPEAGGRATVCFRLVLGETTGRAVRPSGTMPG
ncbi:MAG: putative flavin-nucleotide-binding protein [Gaiellaceae bacterium]|nr:putative flavin-nucleotide-binding protein [Gaiellaceae bacterium]